MRSQSLGRSTLSTGPKRSKPSRRSCWDAELRGVERWNESKSNPSGGDFNMMDGRAAKGFISLGGPLRRFTFCLVWVDVDGVCGWFQQGAGDGRPRQGTLTLLPGHS